MNDYSVEILMSTYNGEKYIREQIESVLFQLDVSIHISIRDDGSLDRTPKILKEYEQLYPKRITVVLGNNIGYINSFLLLLNVAKKADFYGFSDQDDVWLNNKVINAIKMLETKKGPALYVSKVTICDEGLHQIGFSQLEKSARNLPQLFTRNNYPGCCFIFNNELMDVGRRFSDLNLPTNESPTHDLIICSLAFACGTVVFDDRSFLLHRRLNKSVTAGGNGFLKRIRAECRRVFVSKNTRFNLANMMIDKCGDLINKEDLEFLNLVINYKKKWHIRKKLMSYKRMKTKNSIVNLETIIKLLIKNY